MTAVFLNGARTKCCYTSKHRNPLRAPRKELDCSYYKVAYHPYTGEYVGVDACPKKPYNTIYKDNYTVSCTSCDPSINAVCYNPVIRKIQNRNGYMNDKYNYSASHYLQRRNRTFSQLAFDFLSNVPIEGTHGANFNTAQHNSFSLMRDNSDCKVDCFPDCSNCETVACRGYSKCAVKNTNCCAVYKRSNGPFHYQGAVSGGSRINRLKYQTILKSQSTYKIPNPVNPPANNKENAYGSINSSSNVNAINGEMPVTLYRDTIPTYKRHLGGFCARSCKPPTLISMGRCRTRGTLCCFG